MKTSAGTRAGEPIPRGRYSGEPIATIGKWTGKHSHAFLLRAVAYCLHQVQHTLSLLRKANGVLSRCTAAACAGSNGYAAEAVQRLLFAFDVGISKRRVF